MKLAISQPTFYHGKVILFINHVKFVILDDVQFEKRVGNKVILNRMMKSYF